MISNPESVVREIFDLYDRFGNEEYGERISQLEHMSQAAQLAQQEGYDEEVILAAFLHDIGHLSVQGHDYEEMGGFGAMQHDKIGGDFLRSRGFSEKIAALVEAHVEAKRYLTLREAGYYDELSEASKETLRYQGGPMTDKEAILFEADPWFELKIKMRRWDELAKEQDIPIIDLQPMKDMMRRHLQSER